MFRRKTTFVLGAGASMPYGFPSGERLVQMIIHGDLVEASEIDAVGFTSETTEELRSKLIRCGDISIDHFLMKHPHLLDLGKFLIAAILSKCEEDIDLMKNFEHSSTRYLKDDPGKKWYGYLYRKKIEAETVQEIQDNLKDFRFVTFNYDRSLEQFFWNKFINALNFTTLQAKECMRYVRVVHVYGKIGKLEWETDQEENLVVQKYTPCSDPQHILQMSKGIHLIPEDRDKNPLCEVASTDINWAERIHFLGFGWLQENLTRLGLKGKWLKAYENTGRHFGGTFYGWTQEERENFINTYGEMNTQDKDCLTYLRTASSFQNDIV